MPVVNCKQCNKEFYAKPNWIKIGNGKYCSMICSQKGQMRGAYFDCEICKKKVWRIPSKIRHSKSGKIFCTKSCQALWRNKFYSGPLHPSTRQKNNLNYGVYSVMVRTGICGIPRTGSNPVRRPKL